MHSAWFWILLSISAVGTVLCWIRIVRSDDIKFFKVAGFVIAGIPFLGPIFFLFLDMPPRIPEDAQAKREWRGGTTLYTDIRRKLFQGNRRYIAAALGARESDGMGNREFRRAQKRDGRGN
jgi:hypothetical protein